jgi:hypothetical protein
MAAEANPAENGKFVADFTLIPDKKYCQNCEIEHLLRNLTTNHDDEANDIIVCYACKNKHPKCCGGTPMQIIPADAFRDCKIYGEPLPLWGDVQFGIIVNNKVTWPDGVERESWVMCCIGCQEKPRCSQCCQSDSGDIFLDGESYCARCFSCRMCHTAYSTDNPWECQNQDCTFHCCECDNYFHTNEVLGKSRRYEDPFGWMCERCKRNNICPIHFCQLDEWDGWCRKCKNSPY